MPLALYPMRGSAPGFLPPLYVNVLLIDILKYITQPYIKQHFHFAMSSSTKAVYLLRKMASYKPGPLLSHIPALAISQSVYL